MTQQPASPLRYPGGKAVLAPVLADVLVANDLHDGLVVEPFAGGAGASLELLLGEYAGDIHLNDADPRIAAFWRAVVNQPDALVERILHAEPTIGTWNRARAKYRGPAYKSNQIDLAFAVFFLNRCSRSGVLVNGGPIGGHEQRGRWKIDARWDAERLAARIRRIALYREGIKVTCRDARDLLTAPPFDSSRALVFIDPPYYEKGQRLYMNTMQAEDHEELAALLLDEPPFRWVLTYDDVPEVRSLYASLSPRTFTLGYSAYERRLGKELIVFDPRLQLPDDVFRARTKPGRIRFGTVTRGRSAG